MYNFHVHHPQYEFRYFVPDALAVSAHLYFLEAGALARGVRVDEVVDEYVGRRMALRAQVRRDADKLKAWWEVRDQERWEGERSRRFRRHRRCAEFPHSSLALQPGHALTPLLRSVFAKLDKLGFAGYECVRFRNEPERRS